MTASTSKTEREILRRAVTAVRTDGTAELDIAWVERFDAAATLSTLHQHRLHTLWYDAVTRADAGAQLSAELRDGLEELRGHAVERELLYDGVLGEVGESLDRAEVPWLLFKGAELARRIYEPSYLRPLVDADLLVAPGSARLCARLKEG